LPSFDPAAETTRDPNPRLLDGLRVLAIEDHAIGRILLGAMLDGIGVTATLAATGEEALRAADRDHFDVVLVDLGLPDVAGDRLALVLTGRGGTAGAPIVAVTGRERPTVLPPVFGDWLVKPFSARELHAVLSSACRRAAARRG
jgi:DNA-binding response OmpR family regulator